MAGEAYTKRYGAGFADGDASRPVDSEFLNAVETALMRVLGADPVSDGVPVWDAGLARFKFQKLTNAQLDAAAAIDKTKLGPLSITDADVASGANIAFSKIQSAADSWHEVGSAGEPAFASGITNATGFATAAFRSSFGNVVLIKGAVTRSGSGNQVNPALFTLSSAYRPSAKRRIIVATKQSGVEKYSYLDVDTTGVVTAYGTYFDSNDWIAIEVSFAL